MATIPLEDEFGDIIAKARAAHGRGLAEVARESGVPESDLRDLENYRREPTEAETEAIARVLGLDGPRLYAIATGAWTPEEDTEHGDAKAEVVRIQNFVGGYPVFAFLVVCRKTGETAIVDTAADPEGILKAVASRENLNARYLLLTHGHGDHVEGAAALQRELGISAVMSASMRRPSGVTNALHLDEGEALVLGDLSVRLLNTPGHTDHCATFVAGTLAFCGDTLFAGSLGRPNHSYEASRASVAKLFALGDDTRLYPGHGPSTTVAEEKAHNPFFG